MRQVAAISFDSWATSYSDRKQLRLATVKYWHIKRATGSVAKTADQTSPQTA